MKRTKIICTIGPASQSEEKIEELILGGMDVARLNFSHGSHEEQKMKFDRICKVRSRLGLPVAIMLDTKGPEIRLRDFADGSVILKAGQKFSLTTDDIKGDSAKVAISCKELLSDCKRGTRILIDDGLIELEVDEVTGNNINCTVINGGKISDKKGVNVPGVDLSMPYLSDTDYDDIMFGIEMGFDFIAASFTRTQEDVLVIKRILQQNNSHMKVIAKIESVQGVKNLKEILSVADGIMVARGDLGVEIPFEEVPVLQKRMIRMAEASGKYVITATQMLDSMIEHPRPTRAEATDVANAIYDGTTAIMLSGETASGKYPLESVKTMAKIAEYTESDIDYVGLLEKRKDQAELDITTAISHATCSIAAEVRADAIITVTMSGFTAGMVSRYKPNCQIIGCSVNPVVCRQINMMWGVVPILIKKADDAEGLFHEAIDSAEAAGLIHKGEKVVLTAGVPLGESGKTNMLRVITI